MQLVIGYAGSSSYLVSKSAIICLQNIVLNGTTIQFKYNSTSAGKVSTIGWALRDDSANNIRFFRVIRGKTCSARCNSLLGSTFQY